MKSAIALIALAALTTFAQAQDKPAENKPLAPNSPWSVQSTDKTDGYFGSSSTTVTRDIGEGWSVGGKMTAPYQDERIGGSGAPGLKQYESPGNNTTFGPVFEKKF